MNGRAAAVMMKEVGMASITDKGNGTFLITVSKGRINGKQQLVRTIYKPQLYTESGRKRASSSILGEVENYARDFEKEVREGKQITGNRKVTFEKYIPTWDEGYAKNKLTQHVREDYKDILRLHVIPVIGGLHLSAITSDHIQEVINRAVKAGKAPATVRKIFVVCNSVFAHARRKKIIAINPCDREVIDLPSAEDKSIDLTSQDQEHIFSIEETEAFLDFCRKPYTVEVKRKSGTYTQQRSIPLQMQAYFYMAFYLGARRGELCALRWQDIDWNEGTVTINKAVSVTREKGQIEKAPKTANGRRQLEMTPRCAKVLKMWHTEAMEQCLQMGAAWEGFSGIDFDRNYVFIKENGTQISVYTPYQALKNAIAQYNKQAKHGKELPNIRLHDARHTNASLLIRLGMSDADTSKNMGHSNVSITNRIYVHGQKDSAKRAQQVLREALG